MIKKFLLSVFALMGCYTLVWADVQINETNFPDANFRNYLLSTWIGQDGALTDAELAGVTGFDIRSMYIQSLKGIEYFTALTSLDCRSNQLTELDLSQNTVLKELDCYGNRLTALDLSKNTALTKLYCSSNQLTVLDLSKNTALTNLDCSRNQLTELDVSKNTVLVGLYCQYDQLTALDVTKNTALISLYCSTNQLTALDVSKNTALKELNCQENRLTALDVTKNTALKWLYCSSNQLTALDVSKNTALTSLFCKNNRLTKIDISNNTALTSLECYSNQLTGLDVSKNTALTKLDCHSNQLTELDLSQNTALIWLYCSSNQLTALDLSKNTALTSLDCSRNQLTALDVSRCTALTRLDCFMNQIKGAAMDALVEGLPTVSSGIMYVIYYQNEQNVMTVAQVAAAKAKGWIPYYYDTNVRSWKEYEGSQPVNEGIAINAENFPDENFRNYLLSQEYGTDGVLTDAEIDGVTDIDVYGENIQSLKGIEYFTALTSLDCSDNHLMKLDVSQNTALTKLYCYENQLTELDLSKNTALKKLKCYNNQLTALDVSQNIALTSLNCYGNRLTKLNVPQNTALTRLECYQNQIKGAAMDALVESLPTVSDGEMYVIWSENEGNVMTTTQVAAAKAKGWIPFAHDGSRWKEYAGSEPVNPDFATLTYSAGSQSTLQMPVKTGEVTLSIKAEENWTVETLTVNGADRLADLKGNKLALSVEGDTEVRVTFCWADAKTLYTEDFETGIATIQGENIRVYARGGQLCIDGADGREVRLYTVGGMLIQSVVPQAGAIAQFALPAGTYIVQVGKKAAKVVVK